ncbi:uncharacterized protein LOC120850811 [Ixodes scapularis]|uniref:uncharacterized protein LOC120850811 n=1 Tax=Ixodes scapularis TaxID=6945 RepID=UPI001A9DDE2A|nr:uncharacterized protein LOC120850811 [Ixodes scapularis]
MQKLLCKRRIQMRRLKKPVLATSEATLLIAVLFEALILFERQSSPKDKAQFNTAIHQNPELTPSEKFNYLRSALTGDGAAAIGGLHPTAECYADAIELLQQRFGKQETLIQNHMESLMDIQPVPPQRNTRALRRLYDTLQAHIRGLRALGVGEEQVHLRALRFLRDFLRIEVESRERTSKHQLEDVVGKPRPPSLTHGFVKRSTINAQTRSSTAAALNGSVDGLECFLCKSKAHGTPECNARIGLAEKKRRLQADRRCFRCTKANHMARLCRGAPSCGKCQGGHASTMCNPNHAPGKTSTRLNETKPKEPAPVAMHVRGRNSKPAVLLQTLTAWAESTNKRKLARIIFDSGSQRSFITEELSQRLDCKLLGTEILTIGVFGGESTERTFRRVQVTLRDQLYNKRYDIDALETPIICELDLPSPDEAIVATLEELGCPVGDNMAGLEEGGVDILLGSDHYWGCTTGRIHRLSGCLTAVEAAFGWAVQGRTGSETTIVSCSQATVLIATLQDLETTSVLRHFWELGSVGVTDPPVENPSDSAVRREFGANMTKTAGRYEVGLPCKSDVGVKVGVKAQKPLGQVANVLKVLGVTWEPKEDSLMFSPEHVTKTACHQENTKRFVLQTKARLYDPLGFLAPFVVRAKILFQEIWKLNLDWDDVLPNHLQDEWTGRSSELVELERVKIPRFCDDGLLGKVTHRSLRIFADASTAAYGAMVYLRTTDDTGATTTTLLLAKGRVAPLETVRLARLELMASLIASRLSKYVQTCLQLEVKDVHF